jgi:arylformamidase
MLLWHCRSKQSKTVAAPLDPFRTRDHVPDFDEKVAAYKRLSARTRKELPHVADIPYGPNPGQRLDLFLPENGVKGLSVHMFIHGGYWRMFSKDDFSYVARTITGAGAIAVVIDYDLMPAVRLAEVVRQVRDAKAWVSNTIGTYGGDPNRLTVSGHSAGAHLATFLFTDGEQAVPRGALLLSGIYDIRPLRHSFLQPIIELSDDEVRDFSPTSRAFMPRVDTIVLYGERETKPFQTQAGSLAWQLKDAGCNVFLSALSGADHMSCAYDLGFPNRAAGRKLSELIAKHHSRRAI